MANIDIIEGNTKQINRALPFLVNAFNQIDLFANQLTTAVEDSATDPLTLGVMPVTYEQIGLDASASPANTSYLKWVIEITWNATSLVWTISSIRKTCSNITDTTL